jgi:uncharacterized membrane protein YdjX (TVP38/TMEM64 family)
MSQSLSPQPAPEWRGPHRLFVALGLVVLLFGYLQSQKLLWALNMVEQWATESGPLAPFLIAMFSGVWATLCLPGPPVLGLIGTLFTDEPLLGLLVVLWGDTFATVVGFTITRRLARERVRARFAGKPWFEWLEAQVTARGLYAVFVMRMMPFFPNSLANWALGLTNLGFWPYLVVSVVGSIPNLAFYVLGAAGLVHLLRDGLVSQLSLIEGLVLILCLATLTRLFQRFMRRRLEKSSAASEADRP